MFLKAANIAPTSLKHSEVYGSCSLTSERRKLITSLTTEVRSDGDEDYFTPHVCKLVLICVSHSDIQPVTQSAEDVVV